MSSDDGAYVPSERIQQRGATLIVDRITAEVFTELIDAGLRAILLKGPALSRWLYESPSERTYHDTDVLIPPHARTEVEDVLRDLGFVLPVEESEDRHATEHAWIRRRDGVRVDLHWSIVGATVDEATVWDVLSTGTETMEVEGVTVEILGIPARLAHVALHAAQHGSGFDKPQKDLVRAMTRCDDEEWRAAAEVAAALGATPSLAAGLSLTPEGAELGDRLGLSTEVTVEVRLRSEASEHALSLKWFLEHKGLGAKARVVSRKLLPSPDFMRDWHPLARRGRLGLAAAYLIRPFHLLARLPGAAWRLWWASKSGRN